MALTDDQPAPQDGLRIIRDIDAEPEPRRTALYELIERSSRETELILQLHDPDYQK